MSGIENSAYLRLNGLVENFEIETMICIFFCKCDKTDNSPFTSASTLIKKKFRMTCTHTRARNYYVPIAQAGRSFFFLSLSITWFNLDSGAFKCSTVSERAFYFLSEHVELSVKFLSSLCISFYLFPFLSVAPRHARLDVRRAAHARPRARARLFLFSFHRVKPQSVSYNRLFFFLLYSILIVVSSSLASQRATLRPLSPPKDSARRTARNRPRENTRLQYLVLTSRVKEKKYEGRL